MLNEIVRRKIKEVRKQKGFTQEEAALRANMSLSTLQRIERGEKQTIDLDLLEQLAENWEIDYMQLLPLKDSICVETANSSHFVNGSNHVAYHSLNEEMNALFESLIRDKDNTITQLKELVAQQQQLIAQMQHMQRPA